MHFATFMIASQDEKINEDFVMDYMNKFFNDNEEQMQIGIEVEKKDIIKEVNDYIAGLITDENTSVEDLFNKIHKYQGYVSKGKHAQVLKDEHDYVEDESGNLGFKYNPYAFYDWCVIGGRWDSWLKEERPKNIDTYKHNLRNNISTIKEYKEFINKTTNKDKVPHYIVSYKEDEYVSSEGWKRKDILKFLKDYDEKDKIIVIDCHN